MPTPEPSAEPVKVVDESEAVQDRTEAAAEKLATTTAGTEVGKAGALTKAATRRDRREDYRFALAVLTLLVPLAATMIQSWMNGTKLEQVHQKVNSAMRHQLYSSVIYLRRIATLSKDPGDQEALEVAEAALEEHDRQQEKADAKP